jgi:hypothetical protein
MRDSKYRAARCWCADEFAAPRFAAAAHVRQFVARRTADKEKAR